MATARISVDGTKRAQVHSIASQFKVSEPTIVFTLTCYLFSVYSCERSNNVKVTIDSGGKSTDICVPFSYTSDTTLQQLVQELHGTLVGRQTVSSSADAAFTVRMLPPGATASCLGIEIVSMPILGITPIQMQEHFDNVLQSINVDLLQTQRVVELSSVSAADRAQLLTRFCYDETLTEDSLPQKSMAELISEQAVRTPGAIALRSPAGGTLTHRAFDQLANQIAHYLTGEKSISKGTVVAVALSPSFERLALIYALWKIGAVFLPLDPRAPAKRSGQMLTDAGAEVVIVVDASVELAQELKQGQSDIVSISLGELRASTPYKPAESFSAQQSIATTDAATVYFTSGSTGRPKAVINGHRQFIASIEDVRRRFSVTAADKMVLATNVTFDPFVTEFVLPLSVGGSCVVLSYEIAENPLALKGVLEDAALGNALVQMTPTRLDMLLQAGYKPAATTKILCGGEVLPISVARRAGCKIYFRYGTTETTTYSTEAVVDSSELASDTQVIPVGRPTLGTRIYILDQDLHVVPPGVIGRIFIGGVGIAAYMDQEKQRAKFIADPFQEGAVFYDTGDFGRFCADGQLEFCGRKDNQVKILGTRIDLSEIESQLLLQDEVARCAVLVRETEAGKELVAFVEVKEGKVFDDGALRARLQEYLPSKMIPGKIVVIQEMPTTTSGKIDRQQLKAQYLAAAEEKRQVEASGADAESFIKWIWEKTLADYVGKNEADIFGDKSFMQLGGDSAAAMRLINSINAQFSLHLSVVELYGARNFTEFYQRCSKAMQEQATGLPLQCEESSQSTQDACPLSFPQQEILVAMRSQPEAYNSYTVIKFLAQPELVLLESAINCVLQRQQILLVNFNELQPGVVTQRVNAGRVLTVTLDTTKKELDFNGFLEQLSDELHKPFDLERDLLCRCTLFARSDGWILFTVAPHIIFDGLSEQIFCKEVLEVCQALRERQSPALLPLSCTYLGYASSRRTAIRQEDVSFWEEQVRDATTCVLPRSHYRSATPGSDGGGQLFFTILPEVTGRAKSLVKQTGCTLYSFLLAAFDVVVSRYTGEADIMIGTANHGRYEARFEPLIGHFVNVVLARNSIDLDKPFGELMQDVFVSAMRSMEHAKVPYSEVVRIMGAQGIQPPAVMFVFMREEQLSYTDAQVNPFQVPPRHVKYPITLYLTERADGSLKGAMEYSAALYDPSMIQRFVEHYQRLVELVLEEQYRQVAVGELPLLSAANIAELEQLSKSDVYAVDLPKTANVVARFEEVAAANPSSYALSCGGQKMTYSELKTAKDNLARYLLRQWAAQVDCVAITKPVVALYCHKSIDFYTAILAILSIGGAYVPISPEAQVERISQILLEAKANFVVTTDDLAGNLSERCAVPIVRIDLWAKRTTDKSGVVAEDVRLPEPLTIAGEDLAYIIFTSGTTGKPKGALVNHSGLVMLAAVIGKAFRIQVGDRVAAWASVTFDASIWDWAQTLLSGGTLCIPQDRESLVGDKLCQFLMDNAVNVTTISPAVLGTLPSESFLELRGNLRLIMTAGEACPRSLAERLTAHFELWNGYGPTETVICASMYKVSCGELGPVSIGKPLPGKKILVLDRQGQPVPRGVFGELCVAEYGFGQGRALARGYTDETISREKFMQINDHLQPGERLFVYKTGDLVRWDLDGNLEFGGRNDRQVKINGLRIELSEIEAALRTLDGVASAAVLLLNSQLVAFVVPKSIEEDDEFSQRFIGGLEQALSLSALEDYKHPAQYILIDHMPVTAHGKRNDKELEQIFGEVFLSVPQVSEELTATERRLAKLYVQCVNSNKRLPDWEITLANVTKFRTFTQLGGNSIDLMVLIPKVKEEFELSRMVNREVLANESLQEVAAKIDQLLEEKDRMRKPVSAEDVALSLLRDG